jgi:hypothetical protein
LTGLGIWEYIIPLIPINMDYNINGNLMGIWRDLMGLDGIEPEFNWISW